MGRNWFMMAGTHDHNCFCGNCRTIRLQSMVNDIDTLFTTITERLPQAREEKLDALFNIRKREILAGKRYHDVSLNGVNNPRLLRQFKSWARSQQRYQHLLQGTDKERKIFDQHCTYVNNCTTCAEKWEIISHNLNDAQITNIDARSLSVNQLARAVSLSWCHYHNARCTNAAPPVSGEEGTYTRDDVLEVHELIMNHGVINRIGFDSNVAASFMKSLALKILQTCQENE